jgi:hypothetical protein
VFWPAEQIGKRISTLSYRPAVSVILIAESAPDYLLRRSVASVLAQTYANLQLIIVCNGLPESPALEYIERVTAADKRITLIPHSRKKPQAACLADAAPLATGDYVVWIREDAELHPYALLALAFELNGVTAPHVIYFDEDSIDVYGRRSQPVLKPHFDFERFLSYEYIGHSTGIRRDILPSPAELSALCEGAEMRDLLVRVLEICKSYQVRHLSKILYHRRVYDSATTVGIEQQSDNAELAVLTTHIQRTGKSASAEPGIVRNSVRIRYSCPTRTRIAVFLRLQDGPWQVSVLTTEAALKVVRFYEVSGCAVRPTSSALAVTPGLPLGHLDELPEDVLVFINRTLETTNHFFLSELVGHAMRPECGVVTGISVDANRHVLHAGFVIDKDGQVAAPFVGTKFPAATDDIELDFVRSVHSIRGDFFAIRRDRLASIGGLVAISDSTMDRVAHRLAIAAHESDLQVLVTPYSVATFECDRNSIGEDLCPPFANSPLRARGAHA